MIIEVPSIRIVAAIGLVFAVLAAASWGVVPYLKRTQPERDWSELKARIRSWWWIVGAMAFAILLSRTAATVFFAFVSFVALKEYLSLVPTRRADRRVLLLAYLAVPVQYGWVVYPWYELFIIWVPVYMFLILPAGLVAVGETHGFLRAVGTLHWGLMTCVFAISHAAALLYLPVGGAAGGAGLLITLVVLTEGNDVAQYVWGKLYGRTKAIPRVSPGKTVEGLIGGIVTTTVLSAIVAPFLTPFSFLHSLAIGMLLGLTGFVGDVVMSAIKRDLGVKDSGRSIPGHGGVLDRVDSLIFTAPLFFHIARYFYT